ncbi:MAG: hypothetical protein A2W31_08490 [Planctomycetes bacterium RBG_16_64_10]|nr:MAG: hypothetical protein A2W31_08490 [Planctomycetes bacterium RBG_16_64_10]
MDTTIITIEGQTVRAVSPEGQTASMPLSELLNQSTEPPPDSGGVILCNGIRLIYSRGPMTIVVHETPPRVHLFDWIAKHSPARHGPRTCYRPVRIALPYLIVIAMFEQYRLGRRNECFFRVEPLSDQNGEDSPLLYPALLNCSKFSPPDGKPLSWICTAEMDRSVWAQRGDRNQRLRAGLRALLHCLLETGFNYSSEDHEGSSWFTESRRVDPRVATVEDWMAATEQDPLFVLSVPWLKTGMSIRQVVDRIFINHGLPRDRPVSNADLARRIFNYRPTQPK